MLKLEKLKLLRKVAQSKFNNLDRRIKKIEIEERLQNNDRKFEQNELSIFTQVYKTMQPNKPKITLLTKWRTI